MDKAERIRVADRYAKLLAPYAKGKLRMRHDGDGSHVLETKAGSFEIFLGGKWQKRKQPFMVAAVRAGKSYVSIHVMSVYMHPELVTKYAPELKKRMQGKSCFNFQTYDPDAAKGLKALLNAGIAQTRKSALFKPGTFD
jgi:hypothetical protein